MESQRRKKSNVCWVTLGAGTFLAVLLKGIFIFSLASAVGVVSAMSVLNQSFIGESKASSIESDTTMSQHEQPGLFVGRTVSLPSKKTTTTSQAIYQKPFVLYISGSDEYGELANTSRSDVNILIAINPSTKQIQLVTTPRDSMVSFPDSNGALDKLTHVGNYGLDQSIAALSSLYDVKVDYMARLNFSGFINVIDALGGIDVESECAFTTIDGTMIAQGVNHLDGKSALAFTRERYNLPNGDFQRGRDQMAVIKALIEKGSSTAFLSNYQTFFQAIGNCFVTTVPQDLMFAMIGEQLKNPTPWHVETFETAGTCGSSTTFSTPGQYLSVVNLDAASVADAHSKLQAILVGNDYNSNKVFQIEVQ